MTTPSTRRARFTLTLIDQGDEVPVIIRLRRFLKMALRSYGLRCVEAREGGSAQAINTDLDQGDVRSGEAPTIKEF